MLRPDAQCPSTRRMAGGSRARRLLCRLRHVRSDFPSTFAPRLHSASLLLWTRDRSVSSRPLGLAPPRPAGCAESLDRRARCCRTAAANAATVETLRQGRDLGDGADPAGGLCGVGADFGLGSARLRRRRVHADAEGSAGAEDRYRHDLARHRRARHAGGRRRPETRRGGRRRAGCGRPRRMSPRPPKMAATWSPRKPTPRVCAWVSRARGRDTGFGASIAWDEAPSPKRGLSLSLRQSVGGAATGGKDALFSREALTQTGLRTEGSGVADMRAERFVPGPERGRS